MRRTVRFVFEFEQLSYEEGERRRRRYEPLTESVRQLIDATVRTEADDATLATVTAEIDAALAKLRNLQREGTFGVGAPPTAGPFPGATSPWGRGTPSRRRWWFSTTVPTPLTSTSTSARRTRAHPATSTAVTARSSSTIFSVSLPRAMTIRPQLRPGPSRSRNRGPPRLGHRP